MNPENVPTYIKVRSKHANQVNQKYLLPKTLKEFNLPWTWDDSDRDYLIIKQYISQDLQDALFEHSRRLMERKERLHSIGRKVLDELTDDYERSDDDDSDTDDDLFGLRAALLVDLEDQIFLGPRQRKGGPYVSFSVLSPVITVENLRGDLFIAYLSSSSKEDLLMKPESDPSSSLVVTRSTNTQINPQASLSLSQSPSASVSIGLTRSSGLSVQYSVNTWYVSAHRVVNGEYTSVSIESTAQLGIGQESSKAKSTKEHQKTQSLASAEELPRYQWFWAGTHEDTRKLTPDLKHTVTRHVVVKRKLQLVGFPFSDTTNLETRTEQGLPNPEMQIHEQQTRSKPEATPETKSYDHLLQALQHHFTFKFSAQVRVKRRYGRVHRLLVLSGNEVKGKFLKPVYTVNFTLRPPSDWFDELIKDGCRRDSGSIDESTVMTDKTGTKQSVDIVGTEDGPDGKELEKKVSDSEDNSDPFVFPLGPTVDVESMLEKLKDKVRISFWGDEIHANVTKNAGKWDRIQAKRLTDITADPPLMDIHEKKKAPEFYKKVESMKEIIKMRQQDMQEMDREREESKIPDIPALDLDERRRVAKRVVR
ncbi:hypothetical protein TSTA_087080 [Talaromyces stipitatus ATCC 10500]|uniref:Uncharacterized protein n=1 Tax=Talaromyces stipitatus (strain ATCC 10500 / CBS 375.48 / QM 6759 / NRRL 1006) TaxID=441959 RepID=B8M0U2_TALSN|nr:uncharacterized protein TSTA_087080 [Talaromyces stipitatus ATCC 10500]EED21475.1 hypothetical protein TSTA_087080 [Talaromyces stipitatus ATCC 10500]